MTNALTDPIGGASAGDTLIVAYSGRGAWMPDTTDDEIDGRDEALSSHGIRDAASPLDHELHDPFGCTPEQRAHPADFRQLPFRERYPRRRERSRPELAASPSPAAFSFGHRARCAMYTCRARNGGDPLLAGCIDTVYSRDARCNGKPIGAFTCYARKTLETLPADATYETWFRTIRDDLQSGRLPNVPRILETQEARRPKVFA
jgi:hypothetical protein